MGTRATPDVAVLKHWYYVEKLTYQEMADRWYDETGVQLTFQAFGNACKRYGFEPRSVKHSGGDLIPWSPILPDHTGKYIHVRLINEDARRKGKKFDEKETQRMNAWLQGLHDDNAVIAYRPDTIKGWWRVEREPGDTDIIRMPAESEMRREVPKNRKKTA
jgi:hypothetical protein